MKKNKFIESKFLLLTLVAFISILTSLIYFKQDWGSLLWGDETLKDFVKLDFSTSQQEVLQHPFIVQQNGWRVSDKGLAVEANSSANMTIKFPLKEGLRLSTIGMRIWFKDFVDLSTEVWIQGENERAPVLLGKNCFKNEESFLISPYLSGKDSYFYILLKADYQSGLRKSAYPSLQKLQIYFGGFRASHRIPISLALMLLPVIMVVGFLNADKIRQCLSALIIFCLGWGAYLFSASAFYLYVFIVLLLVFFGVRNKSTRFFLALILSAGFWLRWRALLIVQSYLESVDANGYADIAANLVSPYHTENREPLFVWVVWIFQRIFSGQYFVMHMVSLCFSCLLTVVIYYVARKYMRSALAILVCACVAFNPWFVAQSIRGLRYELFTIIVLLVSDKLIAGKPIKGFGNMLSAGILVALLPVLRMYTIFQIPLILGWALLKKNISFRFVLYVLVAGVVVLSPYLIYCSSYHQDPIYAMTNHSTYLRNYEQEGNLLANSWDELKLGSDAYKGERENPVSYILGKHTMYNVLRYVLDGMASIFCGTTSKNSYFGQSYIFCYLSIFGLLISALFRRFEMILLILIWSGPIAFLITASPFVFDGRMVAHIAPYIFMVSFSWVDQILE